MNHRNKDSVVEVHTDKMSIFGAIPLARTSSQASTSSTTPRCRICWIVAGTEKQNDLYQTCYCKGSVEKVHISCLEKWLQESGTDYCDLCFYRYSLKKLPRYTGVWKSLRPFWQDRNNRTSCNELFASVPGITFLVVLGSVCCLLAIKALNDLSDDVTDYTYLLFKFLLTACLLLLLFIYGSMFVSIVQDVISIWRKWNQQQIIVRLIPSTVLNEQQPALMTEQQHHTVDDGTTTASVDDETAKVRIVDGTAAAAVSVEDGTIIGSVNDGTEIGCIDDATTIVSVDGETEKTCVINRTAATVSVDDGTTMTSINDGTVIACVDDRTTTVSVDDEAVRARIINRTAAAVSINSGTVTAGVDDGVAVSVDDGATEAKVGVNDARRQTAVYAAMNKNEQNESALEQL